MRPIAAVELASLAGGVLVGTCPHPITGVSEIDDAGPADLVFAVNPRFVDKVKNSRCGLAVVPEGTSDLVCPHILVPNPYQAMSIILGAFHEYIPSQTERSPQAFIHPEASVDPSVLVYPGVFVDKGTVVGANTILYPNVFVGQGSRIGSDCTVYSNVSIRENCKIGNRVVLQPNCVIGSDGFGFTRIGQEHLKIPQIGGVCIEDDVEIGSGTTVDRGTFRDTVIGAGSKIDNLVQIGHNVVMGRGCLLASQSGISGSTTLGDFVTFAGQSGSVGHIHIGSNTVLMARAVATHDLNGGGYFSGFPCRDHKEDLKDQAAARRMVSMRKLVLKMAALLKIKE
ncbi:MAG: UDP-3-O-(3-hydroxymyristoyl)glucosamine N-acyltransferase [Candidatus Cloacimonetes bacterium]|nr:UDP-3-O-(3-hydroxymyristoyl)glucosamine N-acyltransferase [Candidatus Cloacimonadota bacterium]